MRQDLEILRDLFLPLLEEVAVYSPTLADALLRGGEFWAYFNGALLDGEAQVQELLASYGAKDAAQYVVQTTRLKENYLYHLARSYCAGHTNPTIEMLLQAGDTSFAAEIDFQKDMQAAVMLACRAALKTELEQTAELAGEELPDAEITAAYSTMQRDEARNNLRKQLKQWDEEAPTYPQAKNKKYKTIPLLFLRFVAAAAVATVAVVGVVKVYNSKNRDPAPAGNYRIGAGADTVAHVPAGADTATGAATSQQNPAAPATINGSAYKGHTKHADSPTRAAVYAARIPRIEIKGNIVDTAEGALVTGVLVTLQDDKGDTKTIFSKDGMFHFVLPPHRDFIISGKKENYVSARISLSTKDVKETDPDDVINMTLRLTRE